jgi:hypothetical protein
MPETRSLIGIQGAAQHRATVVNTGIMNIGSGTITITNATVNGEYVEDATI